MLVLAPSYQFRADTVTLSGGNVATIPNRRGADALVMSTGTLAAPAADALFNGARTVAFTGTQRMVSNLAASAWKFLHDGTGSEVFLVFNRVTRAAAGVPWSTYGGGAPYAQLVTNTGGAVQGQITPFTNTTGTLTQDAAWYIDTYCTSVSTTSPAVALFSKEAPQSAIVGAFTPNTSDPTAPLQLGAHSAGSFEVMNFAELLIFTRVLNAEERQTVREYIAARYGIAAPERTYGRVLSLAPRYQFRASDAAISGGNVTSIPNALGTDSLTVTAGTLAAPAADPLFGNAQSVAFTGTQYLTSGLAASNFRFLHDGTGFEEFNVFAPSILSGNRALLSTLSAYAAGAIGYGSAVAGTNNYVQLSNGTAIVFSNNAGALTLNGPTYTNHFFSSTAPINGMNFTQAVVSGSGAQLATPAAGDANSTLILGATVGGANFADMKWCESLIFPRVLHEYERQIVREYIAARYGIAAPSLTGVDRDIMSLLPFSWFDAASYNTSGGKVTAFLDRARPGHTFAQPTSGNQVNNPTADALLNGQPSAIFAGSQFYVSSLALSAWAFLHNGAGMEGRYVYVPISTSGAQALLTTRLSGPGFQLYFNSNTTLISYVENASAQDVSNRTRTFAVNTATALRMRHGLVASPNVTFGLNGNVVTTPYLFTPGGANLYSLSIGAFPTGVGGSVMRAAAVPLFNRLLSAPDDAKLQAALLSKYGVAA